MAEIIGGEAVVTEPVHLKKRMPLSLVIVASIYLLAALLVVAAMVEKLLYTLEIPLLEPIKFIVFLEISYGLLRYRQIWRILAIILICLSVISSGYFLAGVIISPPMDYTWRAFDFVVPFSKPVMASLLIFDLLLLCWQLYVLTRPHIRELFRTIADPHPLKADR